LINSIATLRDYYQKHQNEINMVDGRCLKCHNIKECQRRVKYTSISAIMNMSKEDSRFPGVIFDIFHAHPEIFRLVPESVFVSLYGNKKKERRLQSESCGCCFQGGSAIAEHLAQIEEVYHMLDDDLSKETYINVLMYRLSASKNFIVNGYKGEPQYFIQPFRGENSEAVYVDGGAYTGDTFIEYCKYNAPPKRAYLFEPDQSNIKKLLENVKAFSDKTEIVAIQKGLYYKDAELYIKAGNNMGSRITEDAQSDSVGVSVTAIDSIIQDNISFLKLDVEAFEPFALQGGQQAISRSYPKLAVCIYHRINHLWEIPLMVKRMFPEYSHYLIRHHTLAFNETVFYAYK